MNTEFYQILALNKIREKYQLDPKKWLSTLPNRNTNNLVSQTTDQTNNQSIKKYSLTIILFVVGLILVSVIKNETRNLQKEISNLRASINIIEHDLHQTILDHEVITSPENISRLAKKYLEFDFVTYKKHQIKKINKKKKIITSSENAKNKGVTSKIKLKIAKKIEKKRTELVKLREIYYQPKKLPGEIKLQVAKKIETTKVELKKLYSNPKDQILSDKIYRWGAVQVVKFFLGIPIVPGK